MSEYCHVCLNPVVVRVQFADLLRRAPEFHLCAACQEIFVPISKGADDTAEPLHKNAVLVEHRALFTYNKYTRNYLAQVKAYGDCAAALPAAQSLKGFLQRILSDAGQENICLVPIPGSADAVQKCGFDLTEWLLSTAGFTPSLFLQAGGKQTDRTGNVQAERQFLFRGEGHAQVILFDDIYQSGATMIQAQKLCEKNMCKVLQTVSIFG